MTEQQQVPYPTLIIAAQLARSEALKRKLARNYQQSPFFRFLQTLVSPGNPLIHLLLGGGLGALAAKFSDQSPWKGVAYGAPLGLLIYLLHRYSGTVGGNLLNDPVLAAQLNNLPQYIREQILQAQKQPIAIREPQFF